MKQYHEPFRSSVIIVLIQLILISLVFSIGYSLAEAFLLTLKIPPVYHQYLIYGIFVTHLVKNLFLTYMDVMIVLKWMSTIYIMQEKQLVKRTGIFGINEKMYDLRNTRKILIHKSILGKIFNYGDIAITTSASGGYQEEVYLSAISRPEKYKTHLQECFELKDEKPQTLYNYNR